MSLVLLALGLAPLGCAARFDVDGARAYARVVQQVNAGPRIPGSPGHETVRRWLNSELKRLGGRVEEQIVADTTLGIPMELVNIIGRFGPDSARRIVLCAHWDTRPWCDQDADSSHRADPLPGANDGASGVAVLLEVAELMSRKAPPIGVDLVFFDAEDQGEANRAEHFSIGARAYARGWTSGTQRGPKPAAAFLFDMVGDRDLQIYPEVESASKASSLVRIVGDAARATSATHFHDTPRYPLIDDHLPLLEASIPAVDVIDFDYPAWHTHRDLPDQVSAESLAEVSRVAAWIVYRSALTRR